MISIFIYKRVVYAICAYTAFSSLDIYAMIYINLYTCFIED